MSTRPYSKDIRDKVINYLKKGNTQREASRLFNLSKTTINNWNVRYKKEGHYLARKRLGAKSKIIQEDFINYIKENSNATSEEIGKAFGISGSGVRYWLRALGYSYKKKPSPMWKQAKRNELSTKNL